MTRTAFLFFIASIGLLGCATQPEAAVEGPITAARRTEHHVRRSVLVIKPKSEDDRGSEQDAVTDDAPDPEAAKLFEAQMGTTPVPLHATKNPPRVTAIRLDDSARGDAVGMKPAGDIYEAKLSEGERAAMPMAIAPGQCLTMIAVGGVGAIEVDLFLTTAESGRPRILAEDPGTGPIGVIGGHGKCFTTDKPVDATLNAVVRRGAGAVLVQVFEKAK